MIELEAERGREWEKEKENIYSQRNHYVKDYNLIEQHRKMKSEWKHSINEHRSKEKQRIKFAKHETIVYSQNKTAACHICENGCKIHQ